MKKTLYSVLALFLCLATVFSATACANLQASSLTDDLLSQPVTGKNADRNFAVAYTDFALKLLQKTNAGKTDTTSNTLISPLSVMLALALTANGATGETRAEMEALLGGGISLEDLNNYLYTYSNSLPSSDSTKIKLANSVWFRSDVPVRTTFLQNATNYYLAGLYEEPFNAETVKKINAWISDRTDGMIKNMLEGISADSMMYLINAVLFDAEWSTKYEHNQITKGTFTNAAGSKEKASFMNSHEYYYMEFDNAVGFCKNYKGEKYSFAAILPDEGMSTGDFLASLSAKNLQKAFSEKDTSVDVLAQIPIFSYDYETEMADILSSLGMKKAFSSTEADFSAMADLDAFGMPLYIGSVLHKTHIEVDTAGTRAAAATIVDMKCGSAAPEERKTVEIYLDRPFVYAIIDNETGMPIFFGTVESIDS